MRRKNINRYNHFVLFFTYFIFYLLVFYILYLKPLVYFGFIDELMSFEWFEYLVDLNLNLNLIYL